MSALIIAAVIAGFFVFCAVLEHTPLGDAAVFAWLGLGGDE